MIYSELLAKHQSFYDSHATHDIQWRIQQLQQIKKLVTDNEATLLKALTCDLHKPELEAWMTELAFVTGDIDHVIKKLPKWAKKRKVSTPIVVQPGNSYVQPEPQGTVLIIGAWNYPLQLILAPLVAVIAAGNCAIVKPSELAPATSAALAELIPKYLPPQLVSIVEGAVEETTALLALNFDHIMYTGNAQVAKIVMTAAAKHLTPVTLELGGKSPTFIDDSADITITAQRLAWGKWMNAGQTCIAPDYVLTTKAMVGPLVAALKKQIHLMFGDDPKQSKSYGRIINQKHSQRINDYLNNIDTVVGGNIDIEQNYIAPTIVIDPPTDSALMQDEIFGPILPIITVDNFAQAIKFVKQGEKPLAAYIFSRDKSQCKQWVDEISTGSQCINDVIMFSAVPELPFGGIGNSGIGQYSGKAGFDNFSHLKSVLSRPFIKDLPVRFAPYKTWKFKFLRLIR